MKEINHECYVSLEVAKLLKEAGFDWDVYKVYELNQENKKLFGEIANWQGKAVREDVLPMPTLTVAQRWLREVNGKEVEIEVFPDELVGTTWGFNLYDLDTYDSIVFSNPYTYNTYEEAQETGIKKVLEIILEKGETEI